jgi:hypothetical protein
MGYSPQSFYCEESYWISKLAPRHSCGSKWQPGYSNLLGNLAAGGTSNTILPPTAERPSSSGMVVSSQPRELSERSSRNSSQTSNMFSSTKRNRPQLSQSRIAAEFVLELSQNSLCAKIWLDWLTATDVTGKPALACRPNLATVRIQMELSSGAELYDCHAVFRVGRRNA